MHSVVYITYMQNCTEELFCSLNILVLEVFMECGGTAISVFDSRDSRFEGFCCFEPWEILFTAHFPSSFSGTNECLTVIDDCI